MTTDSDTHPDGPDEPTARLDHVTIENEALPDECAIFPAESSDVEQPASWIVAHDSAFVSLRDMR